jgi:hypothetical protein
MKVHPLKKFYNREDSDGFDSRTSKKSGKLKRVSDMIEEGCAASSFVMSLPSLYQLFI